jgi:polyisoprenoid-binding protein YceI
MNSDAYPKADFKGIIKDLGKIDFTKEGTYPAVVDGNLTIHGVANKVTAQGTVTVKGGKISTAARFPVKLTDYKVTVPAFSAAKVSDVVEVTVSCTYEPYK